ncbi:MULTISPECIES: CaiB/BaiF CoA transferase family protein [Bacillaceae]|uniref:CaiB/BaiF CoA transferase family protein n=1 Tax=Bacillaceae TaxID=186817 RepID=UPI000B32B44F|nr:MULTISPECIES: CaiB/BaiF CoA-transferase family protein [Bacillaceae]MED4474121.1 CaiB/BaiF CoA-transferase family protein [Oceanobacillus caeni]
MPLTSIRVLDLSRLLPGPYCSMLLADFGAEVIKIEEPGIGDYARENLPKLDKDSAFFHSLNRNKKSVCLNLKSAEGKENFLRLVKDADVVIESFRPGVMKRLGLDYETLREVNPGIIYCAITGYGQDGPYANFPGHDVNYTSYAGLLNLMGERNGKPQIPAAQIADIGGGALPAAVGILLALFGREKTGKGQMVDISMLDGVISWLPTLLPGFLATNEHPKRGELVLSGKLACYEVYQTKDEKWLSVGALELKFWNEFCKAIGREDFISKLDAPMEVQDQMKIEIQNIISRKSLDEWMGIFSEVDSCVAPVLSFDEMIENPQVKAREMIKNVNHSELGSIKQVGIPIKLSETPGEIRDLAPKLGEHTKEILEEIGVIK